MTVEEILNVAQSMTFQERKRLIQGLFAQMPKSPELAGTIEFVGDWEAGKQTVRTMINESLAHSTDQLLVDQPEDSAGNPKDKERP
jgi:hypothetical protein